MPLAVFLLIIYLGYVSACPLSQVCRCACILQLLSANCESNFQYNVLSELIYYWWFNEIFVKEICLWISKSGHHSYMFNMTIHQFPT